MPFWNDENLEKSPKKHTISEKDFARAKRLKEFLTKLGRSVSRHYSNKKWAHTISNIRNLDGVKDEVIDQVLAWYEKNYDGKYVPKIYSADSLREKFNGLVEAMSKKPDLPVSNVCLIIYENLKSLTWPMNTEKDLPTAIQITYTNFENFRSQIIDICEHNPEFIQIKSKKSNTIINQPNLQYIRFCHYLKDKITPFAKTEIWFRDVHEYISNSLTWNGDLISLAWNGSLQDPRFTKLIGKFGFEWDNSYYAWNTLLEKLA